MACDFRSAISGERAKSRSPDCRMTIALKQITKRFARIDTKILEMTFGALFRPTALFDACLRSFLLGDHRTEPRNFTCIEVVFLGTDLPNQSQRKSPSVKPNPSPPRQPAWPRQECPPRGSERPIALASRVQWPRRLTRCNARQ